ncbi:hypothetical protein QYM36_014938 [Artemia franciscana]|uniref:Reverse transcriptase domain-containing protein n=1 Tax=Artemia franciscana TaxID=6661 RepID=A0AA88HGM7_ARTSF|nr:hypothetical protein QYM36_014938 [Artemia franciscana]
MLLEFMAAFDSVTRESLWQIMVEDERALSSSDGVIILLGINVSDLDYVDDIDALSADPATAQAMLNEIAHFFQLLGMKINTAKTKVMDLNIQSDYQLVLYRQELEKSIASPILAQ